MSQIKLPKYFLKEGKKLQKNHVFSLKTKVKVKL